MRYYKITEKSTGEFVLIDESYMLPLWTVLKGNGEFKVEDISEEHYKFLLDKMVKPM